MKTTHTLLFLSFIMLSMGISACTPAATPVTPTVDVVSTVAAQLASSMLTQTAAAIPPTPIPATSTPEPTATATLEPMPAATQPPTITGTAPCYQSPSTSAPLVSNISDTKIVELLAVGSTPGWYKIKNPYYNSACWVQASNLILDPGMDLSVFPVEAK